jgi:hypothetical protein
MKIKLLFAICTLCLLQIKAQNIITTIAGNGTIGYSGDGGAATASTLKYPTGVVCDHLGNTYICDHNSTVRKIDANGIITHVATVYEPTAMACDKHNNIYVTSINHNAVYKITPNGIKTRLAGIVQTTGSYSGDGGLATQANLNTPYGIAVDSSDNVYIATTGDSRIRMVNTAGIISTICGDGNIVTTIGQMGDGGPAINGKLSAVRGLAFDKANNLYIVQQIGSIRIINSAGIINTFAGDLYAGAGYGGDGGPAMAGQFNNPMYMTFDSTGNIYISDMANYVIRKIDTNGQLSTYAGTFHNTSFPNSWSGAYSGDGGDPLLCEINRPLGLTVNNKNELIFVDYYNHAIRKIANNTGIGELKQDQLFSVYPNPSNGIFTIDVMNEKADIMILDLLGNTVYEAKQTKGSVEIDLENIASGVYLVKVHSNQMHATKRIVIN